MRQNIGQKHSESQKVWKFRRGTVCDTLFVGGLYLNNLTLLGNFHL